MLKPGSYFRHEKTAVSITNNPMLLTSLLCVAWTMFGLIGHDPWKSEEALLISHLSQFTSSDFCLDLLAINDVTLAGPLFYLIAINFIEIWSSVLAPHDAARLTLSVWLLSAILFTALTAGELWGRTQSWVAPLLLIGSVGLLVKSHQLSATPVLISGLAIFFYGLASAPRRSIVGGVWLGLGVSIILLGTAFQNVAIPVFTIFLMSLINLRYRGLRFTASLAIAGLIVIMSAGIWLTILNQSDPSFPARWVALAWSGATDSFKVPSMHELIYQTSALPWFTWPTWIFLVWSLWVEGREGLKRKELQLPIVLGIAITLVLVFTTINKESGLGPILLPFALIGSIAASRIPRSVGTALYWFAIMASAFFTITVWVYFSASHFGFPQELSEHLLELLPGYESEKRDIAVLLAALLTATWFLLIFNIKRLPERSILIWAMNLTFGWMLSVLLLFHWIDERKTYAPMVHSMMRHIDPNYDCIIAQVGPAQRGLIQYYGRIVTTDIYIEKNGQSCDYLIYQDHSEADNHIGLPWSMIWEGGRVGDRAERYRLYKREIGLD